MLRTWSTIQGETTLNSNPGSTTKKPLILQFPSTTWNQRKVVDPNAPSARERSQMYRSKNNLSTKERYELDQSTTRVVLMDAGATSNVGVS